MDVTRKPLRIAAPWLELIARVGLVSKGFAYLLLGVFASMYLLGARDKPLDFKGAMRQLDVNPVGQILLIALGVGLIAYGVWRGIQALADPENKKPEKVRWGKRLGYGVTCLAHVWLAAFALRKGFGLGDDGQSSEKATENATSQVMSLPMGAWLVGAAGGALIAYGLCQAYFGFTDTFKKKLKTEEMSEKEEKWVTISGRFGFFTRAVVFGTIGTFLLIAALALDPRKAVGIQGSLEVLATRQIGAWPLAVVAAGLCTYGVFMLIQARYRYIKPSARSG